MTKLFAHVAVGAVAVTITSALSAYSTVVIHWRSMRARATHPDNNTEGLTI